MNKIRRNQLNSLQDKINALDLASVLSEVREIATQLECLRDEEQDSFDNLPESLQEGERGQDMQHAIDAIQSALDILEPLGEMKDGGNDAVSFIEDAKGMA